MSNLFKSGFTGITNVTAEPYIVDVNSRVIEKVNSNNKVIRPVSESEQPEDNIEKDPDNKIVLDEAIDMANDIRTEAYEKANEIIESANAEAENIKEQARKEGYEQGLEEGGLEAAKRADEYLANIQHEQDVVFQKNEEECNRIIDESKENMIDFCCEMIAKLTGILVDDYRPVMLHMINRALANEESGKNIVIKVPSESYIYVSDNRDRIIGAANPSINMDIYEDTKLTGRQCIIETDNGIIDLSMEIQVNNLITAIKLLS